jgi:hypothetical protein
MEGSGIHDESRRSVVEIEEIMRTAKLEKEASAR